MSASKAVQFINGPDGEQAFAAIPIDQYRSMARDLEAFEDLKSGARELAGIAAGSEGIPADVAHRIADGDNPVRVWREFRGLKAVALARAAGISPAYLSEIETGKKEGTFRTMTALARHLEISLDDLAPPSDESDAEGLRRTGREAALRAEIAGIRAAIASGAFDSGAVRAAAARLERDTDALVADGADATWAAALRAAVSRIVTLVDQAEHDIIETAQTTQAQLEEIMALEAFTPEQAGARKARPDVPDVAGEAAPDETPGWRRALGR